MGQSIWQSFLSHRLFRNKCFGILSCHESSDDDDTEFTVYMNENDANARFNYPNNYICTTRYSLLTFLPLGLVFQFSKTSNLYFLVNMCLCLIPGASPITPLTAIFPLVFVVLVALVKEGAEDIRRHRADRQANSFLVEVLRNGQIITIPSRNLMAGDIVRVNFGEEIRADIVLLSSTAEEGQAFIDTCKLDGETNLKSRKAIEATWNLQSPEDFMQAKIVLRASAPDPGLFSWIGMIEVNGDNYALSLDQFLYRGCVLRNTASVWGMVVYTGVNTKMFKNLKDKPPRLSFLDDTLNKFIGGVFIIQNICIFILCSFACWWNHNRSKYWYLDYYINRYSVIKIWIYRYITYFILLSYSIPISLFVTIEICKVIQTLWMRKDPEMMGLVSGSWHRCRVNTSSLNEQLAIVKFIFTDKTGTLTENVMQFKRGDVLGIAINANNLHDLHDLFAPDHPHHAAVSEYFLALALCNSIYPFQDKFDTNDVVYEGSSPDERVLVDTAAKMGFRMIKRTTQHITLLIGENEKKFSILATLEFTPDRKMMSIIVEDTDTHKITLYNKGADSFVKSQLSAAPEVQANMERADVVLTEMSLTGLRTLLVCSKEIDRASFEAWNARFCEAGKSLQNRSALVDKVCLDMECDLHLVGITAIEDCLQDEVPETLSFFLNAGVAVWMLTGDKRETAVTIAATSTLCDPRIDFIDHIDIGALDPNTPTAIEKVGSDLRVVKQHLVLRGTTAAKRCTFVIDGPVLKILMDHYFDLFLEVSQSVNSAICCRLTPIQKGSIVHMIQKSTGYTALAIGDGSNDVSMIREGRVGVGIIGLEGAQAVLAADYAIPRFKHLRRLCAIHGRYSFLRISSCIIVCFYKNIVLTITQLVFAFYSGFSGFTLIDGWLLTLFNIVLTSIQPFCLGIFEKDLPEVILMENPKLFSQLFSGLYFNNYLVARWMLEAVFGGLILFYITYPTLLMQDGTARQSFSGLLCGTLIFSGIVLTVLVRIALFIQYWQWLQLLGTVLSLVAFFVFISIYSSFPSFMGSSSFYWQAF